MEISHDGLDATVAASHRRPTGVLCAVGDSHVYFSAGGITFYGLKL